MSQPAERLRRDALAIWQAGVDRVRSERLIAEVVSVEGSSLTIAGERLDLSSVGRIAVVGAGKAGTGMAAALEEALGARVLDEKQVAGWVNVPADCVRPLERIHLHAARPAGSNEPTEAGAAGTSEILRLVGSLGPEDLCIALVSGGGSALLPAPVEGVPLAEKLALTRHLSAAGANIEQLNLIRKHLSRIKGGGLARACRAGRMIALLISDVPGDRLDVIASGPTVADDSTPRQALAVLETFGVARAGIAPAAIEYLTQRAGASREGIVCRVRNVIIGNCAMAVDAAAEQARRLGYSPQASIAQQPEGSAEGVGRQLARAAIAMQAGGAIDALVSGGEPTVQLVDASRRGVGGRNQQLALAAMIELANDRSGEIAILSGGTDGEDGPTDAAGAVIDAATIARAQSLRLDLGEFLARNDAYSALERVGALIKTGPTHTNIGDLRVVLVDRRR